MRGLHKKQGKFSRAVDHLIETQVKEEDRDGADDVVSETSCDRIDISGIDFGNKKKVTSPKLQEQKELLNPHETSSLLSSTEVDNLTVTENNSPVTSEMKSQLLNKNVKKPTSILYEGQEESKLIDGMQDDNYIAVINCINIIDEMLQDHNNGDIEATWYDAIDISSINFQHCCIMEGILSTDIF